MRASGELRLLREQRLLGDLDLHFADLICRLAGDDGPELALAAALASSVTGRGHVCLELERPADGLAGPAVALRVPERDAWERSLRASRVVGSPGEFRPLILDGHGRLYLYRYWAYQQLLAEELLRRTREAPDPLDEALLQASLAQLFPDPPPGGTDWQKIAAASALMRRFTLISGGPGTGKTSTVVRILALLQQQATGSGLDIALAAPTGKAAARLQESIRQAKERLPLSRAVRERIPEQATTLHRLLGSRPDTHLLRYHRDNPLPLDALILDEASMVDLALMAKLLQALPDRARLIMLGDRNQLSSVEAGAVLGDICGDAPGFTPGFAARLKALTGESVPSGGKAVSSLGDSVVVLRHSYRFGSDSGIGRLAAAVNSGNGVACLAYLADKRLTDVRLLAETEDPIVRGVDGYREYLACVNADAPPDEVFAAFARFRVLCALRRGRCGAEGLNRAVEQALAAADMLDDGRQWYPGRPVMIRRNDYNLHLYNGDVGILLPGGERGHRVCFPTADGSFRWIPAARLPEHDTVFATTVHKSQGSEFDRVLLVLPEQDSPLLSRELIYTAVTRARTGFELSAGSAILQLAVARRLHRSSGLHEALWG